MANNRKGLLRRPPWGGRFARVPEQGGWCAGGEEAHRRDAEEARLEAGAGGERGDAPADAVVALEVEHAKCRPEDTTLPSAEEANGDDSYNNNDGNGDNNNNNNNKGGGGGSGTAVRRNEVGGGATKILRA